VHAVGDITGRRLGYGYKGFTEAVDKAEDGHVGAEDGCDKYRPDWINNVRTEVIEKRCYGERSDGLSGFFLFHNMIRLYGCLCTPPALPRD